MINQSANATAHKSQESTSIAYGIKFTRRDAVVVAVCTADVDCTVSAVTYLANGLSISDMEFNGGLAVGNGEIVTLNDGTLFDETEILNGLWDGATFDLIQFNYLNPSNWNRSILSGLVGEIKGVGTKNLSIELRDYRQYLQLPIGFQTAPVCQYRLGDPKTCRWNLAGLGTFSGALTHVTDNQTFRDSARAEGADFFGAGEIEFTTGNNAGAKCMILTHTADGTFTIPNSLFAAVQIGDQYTVYRGCRKTLSACKVIQGHVYNFGGCPHKPNQDDYLKGGNANAV